jgi:Fe-S-cluster containining protein
MYTSIICYLWILILFAKLKRSLTSFLPIAPNRTGACKECGACCKLPNVCLFLKYRPDGRSYCGIYHFRPLNCRKYPRTPDEFLTEEVCGFRFEDNGNNGKNGEDDK